MHRALSSFVALSLCAAACGSSKPAPRGNPPDTGDPEWSPPQESCAPLDLDDIQAFSPCTSGSGIFGKWSVDDQGLPAYDYELDENADPRAAYPNTESDDRRYQWAAFGNRRVNALAFNDGYIEIVTQDRGPEYLNRFEPEQQNYAGGFGYVDDGTDTWPTAYAWRPKLARTSRRFGMGYAESALQYHGVLVARVTAAPPGDAPVVLSDVTLENLSGETKHLRYYEYWDVARRPLEINWLVSGQAFPGVPDQVRAARDQRNALFDESVSYDAAQQLLGLRRKYVSATPRPDASTPDKVDDYPGDPFAAEIIGTVSDVYTEQASFFGKGGVAAPDAVTSRAAGQGVSGGSLGAAAAGLGQPRAFVFRSDLTLGPGQKKTLRFAYGYARIGDAFAIDPQWRDPSYDARADYAATLRPRLFYFGADRDPFLHRELAWDAYQVETSVGYRDYWQSHVVPQGSAYLYLHGADGATRDLALFAVPLVYTDPELAKQELELTMGLQYSADHRFSYAFEGNGVLDDATIHKDPSDLGLFFAWALGEYLGATGDLGFLDEKVPFYPRSASSAATVRDHLVGALRHQFDDIGTGAHGLIRLQSGDWNDGIAFEAPDHDLAVSDGESVPNTQMAVAILPRIADLVEPRDAELAAEIRLHVAAYRQAVKQAWGGKFFYRAYFGNGVWDDTQTIDLESQVWALIGGTFDAPGERATLVDQIASQLDDPSPTGAPLTPGGQVWPAVSGLLTWGYALSDANRAWQHFARNTLAAHADAFPDEWDGIWSGPDGVESKTGEAWASAATPMTDFPVQNNNQHTMPILAALRVAGIDATASGLVIAPHVPGRTFSLSSTLIDLSERGATLSGAYRPTGTAPRTLEVDAPPGQTLESASLDGKVVALKPGSTSVRFAIDPAQAEELQFEAVTAK
jgi:Glycosyl hydrolase 36 superfamily, catalytic domain/Glycosyltransferase family 36